MINFDEQRAPKRAAAAVIVCAAALLVQACNPDGGTKTDSTTAPINSVEIEPPAEPTFSKIGSSSVWAADGKNVILSTNDDGVETLSFLDRSLTSFGSYPSNMLTVGNFDAVRLSLNYSKPENSPAIGVMRIPDLAPTGNIEIVFGESGLRLSPTTAAGSDSIVTLAEENGKSVIMLELPEGKNMVMFQVLPTYANMAFEPRKEETGALFIRNLEISGRTQG